MVRDTTDVINRFLNPFNPEAKDQLLILSSGSAASDDVAKKVLNAEEIGQQARDTFIEKRLIMGQYFFEPVKRSHLKTLEDMKQVSKMKTTKNNVVHYKQQGNFALRLLMKSRNQGLRPDLKELMTYDLLNDVMTYDLRLTT